MNAEEGGLVPKSPYGGPQKTHTLGQFDDQTHEGPSWTVPKGHKHEMAHKELFTCNEQDSVDVGEASEWDRRGD